MGRSAVVITVSSVRIEMKQEQSCLTDADDVHEAIHAVADLEKQILPLPAGRRAKGGPDQPGDTGHEEEGAQDGRCYLHFLYDGEGDRLPLERDADAVMLHNVGFLSII